jgi:hypothetical protein
MTPRTYEVVGKGRDTGRRRRRHYLVNTEVEARALAEADGTIVESISELAADPPTERQLEFANKLGIVVPHNASKEELSDLIDVKLQRDKPPSPVYRAFAERHGVRLTQYTGKKALFDRLFGRLVMPGREEDLLAWFVFRVYRTLAEGRPDAAITSPDDPAIRAIATDLATDPQVVGSVRRYEEGQRLIWFGTFTAPDGVVHQGGSTQTVAYKRAAELLRRTAPSELGGGRRELVRPPEAGRRDDRLERLTLARRMPMSSGDRDHRGGALRLAIIITIITAALVGTGAWLTGAIP